MKSLEKILRDIQQIVERNDHLDSTLNIDPTSPLKQVATELSRILEKIPLVSLGKRAKVARSLKWPFEKAGVEKSIATIERHKSSLSLDIGITN